MQTLPSSFAVVNNEISMKKKKNFQYVTNDYATLTRMSNRNSKRKSNTCETRLGFGGQIYHRSQRITNLLIQVQKCISIETLYNKTVGVDALIWTIQFIKN